MHLPLIVYEIEGENKLPSVILESKKSLKCETIDFNELVYDDVSSYFGLLSNRNITYQGYKNEIYNKIEKLKEKYRLYYEQAISKEYFESTKNLAEEYIRCKQEDEELYKKVPHNKKYYRSEVYLNFKNFIQNHPEISNPLDIRFTAFFDDELINDPKRPDVKMVTHFYEPAPNVEYEEYRDFIEFSYPKIVEREIGYVESELNEIEYEFNSIFNKIQELLKNHDKVGILYFSDYGSPTRYIEKDFKKYSDFTIDDYLKFKHRVVYWLSK